MEQKINTIFKIFDNSPIACDMPLTMQASRFSNPH